MADPNSMVFRGIEGTGEAYINKGIGLNPGEVLLRQFEQRRKEKAEAQAKKDEANKTAYQKIQDISTPWAEYGKTFQDRQKALVEKAAGVIGTGGNIYANPEIQKEVAFLTNMSGFSEQQKKIYDENSTQLTQNPNKYDTKAYEQSLAAWRSLPDEDKIVTPVPKLAAVYRVQEDIDNFMKNRPELSFKSEGTMSIGGKQYIAGEEIKGKLVQQTPILDSAGKPTGQFRFTGYGATDDMIEAFTSTYPGALSWAEAKAEEVKRTTGEVKAPLEVLRETFNETYKPSTAKDIAAGVNFAPREKKEDKKVVKTIEYNVMRNYNMSMMKPGEKAAVKPGVRPVEISYAEEGGNRPIQVAPSVMINQDKNREIANTNVAGTTGQTGRLPVRILALQLWPVNKKTGKLYNMKQEDLAAMYQKGQIDFRWMADGVYEDTRQKGSGKTQKVENRVLINYEDIKKELAANYDTTPDELSMLQQKYLQELGTVPTTNTTKTTPATKSTPKKDDPLGIL